MKKIFTLLSVIFYSAFAFAQFGTNGGTRTNFGSNIPVTFNAPVSGTAFPFLVSPIHTATGNSQIQGSFRINPTYNDGAFTGIIHNPIAIDFATSHFSISDITGASQIALNANTTPTVSNYFLRTDGSSVWINAASGTLFLRTTNNPALAIFQTTQNVAIGTTTDAGYKLDINGSLRSQGKFTQVIGAGTATLVSGTVTVPLTATTANSILFLTYKTPSGTIGYLQQGTLTAGTSFVINSLTSAGALNTADNSIVNYWLIN